MADLAPGSGRPSLLLEAPFKLGPNYTNDFIENRLNSVDEDFSAISIPIVRASDGTYTSGAVPGSFAVKMTPKMVKQQESFQAALKKYVKKKGLPPATEASFDQVMKTLSETAQEYHATKEGSLGKLRKCWQNFYRLQKPIECWMRMLPSESWQGSLICGGLKIIFSAAAQLQKVREDVEKALEEIPITIWKVQSFIDLYNQQVLNQEYAEELYIVVLLIIEKCLDWFGTNAAMRTMKVLVMNDEYGRTLQEKTKRLATLERRIEDKAQICHMQMTSKIGESVAKMEQTTVENKDKSELVVASFYSLLRDQEKHFMAQEHINTLIRSAQLAEQERQRELQKRIDAETRLAEEWKKNLMYSLPYDEVKSLMDFNECFSMQPVGYANTKDTAAWIMGSDAISIWLASPRSQVLLVNGQEARHGNGESAVSMFSAMLIQSLVAVDSNVTVLYWFAGQNIQADAHTMAIALLGQLLRNGSAVLRGDQVQDIEGIYPTVGVALSNTIAVLTLLGRWIQEQLKTTSIYCVLDSVSCYEDHRTDDLLELYRMLQLVAKTWQGKHCLKVLITSPMRSAYIGTCDDALDLMILSVDLAAYGTPARLGGLPVTYTPYEPLLLSDGTELIDEQAQSSNGSPASANKIKKEKRRPRRPRSSEDSE